MHVLKKLLIAFALAVLPLTAARADVQVVRLDDGLLRADKVVIMKEQRRLMLLKNGYVVREYSIALGRNPVGPKQMQGDGRTPEGSYVLDWRNPNSRFYRSIHISYPNEIDLAEARRLGARPGGMIMIHGTPNRTRTGNYGLRPDWTEGCIAVSNAVMDEIWDKVADGTPIEIRP